MIKDDNGEYGILAKITPLEINYLLNCIVILIKLNIINKNLITDSNLIQKKFRGRSCPRLQFLNCFFIIKKVKVDIFEFNVVMSKFFAFLNRLL